jgi:ppGpp synthetase/RelA/SpoT-type nucleotidyltranferase
MISRDALRDELELQLLDALRGADDVTRRLTIEMATGTPSVTDMAYAIKMRIKQDYKIVAKVLRKRKEKNDPTYNVKRLRDLVGLRIVTLYRLDALQIIPALLAKIFASHSDATGLFVSDRFEEIVIYSTNIEGDAQGLVPRLQATFEAFGLEGKVRVEASATNYTSIHIVVWCRGKYSNDYREIPIEIQIRTALEDVWGEIDHSLKYKREEAGPNPAGGKRVDTILAHLNVMKTLIDGVAQYGDQIKIQLDELSDDRLLRPDSSRQAQNAVELLNQIPDVPQSIRALVAEAVALQSEVLGKGVDEASLLQNLHDARQKLETAMSELQAADFQRKEEAMYAIYMEGAFVLAEIGKRVEGGANVLAEAAKLYRACEDKFPQRALIKYRLGAALDLLGDRASAKAKFREVSHLIHEGVSELPPAHWVRSAAVRYLGTLIWEEARALPTTQNGGGIGPPFRPMLQVTLGPADLTAGARQDPSKALEDDLNVLPPGIDHAQFAVFRGRNGDIHTVSLEKRGNSSRLRGGSRRRARVVHPSPPLIRPTRGSLVAPWLEPAFALLARSNPCQ